MLGQPGLDSRGGDEESTQPADCLYVWGGVRVCVCIRMCVCVRAALLCACCLLISTAAAASAVVALYR